MINTNGAKQRRPRIYISSTVFDFRDLRSALKFYLEELGYEVMLSEHNDFDKPVDVNSYDACLEAIRSSDYFVLMIGSRVGGWYSRQDKVTITRMEYRRAYDLAKERRLKLVVLVRDDIWTIREDRKSMRELLEREYKHQHELTENDICRIANHCSTFVNDADFVFDFLHEVARIDEMRRAIESGNGFPPGNWIHPFRSFRDVIDVLRTQLAVSRDIARLALEVNLKREITKNARCLLWKSSGKLIPQLLDLNALRGCFRGGPKDRSSIPGDQVASLAAFVNFGLARSAEFSTVFLTEALNSGYLLEFDTESGSYREGLLTRRLHELRDAIDLLRRREGHIDHAEQIRFAVGLRERIGLPIEIPNERLVPYVAVHDAQYNVLALASAILRALDGDMAALGSIPCFPMSPFEGRNVEAKLPSDAEVNEYLVRTWPEHTRQRKG